MLNYFTQQQGNSFSFPLADNDKGSCLFNSSEHSHLFALCCPLTIWMLDYETLMPWNKTSLAGINHSEGLTWSELSKPSCQCEVYMLLASVSSYSKGEGKTSENVYSCDVHAELESSSQLFIYYRMWTENDLIIMLYYSCAAWAHRNRFRHPWCPN